MRPRSGKRQKQMGSDPSNLITVPITPYNNTAVQDLSNDLINCQAICNKSMNYLMLVGIWSLMLSSSQRLRRLFQTRRLSFTF